MASKTGPRWFYQKSQKPVIFWYKIQFSKF
jgi:hypothetical protein